MDRAKEGKEKTDKTPEKKGKAPDKGEKAVEKTQGVQVRMVVTDEASRILNTEEAQMLVKMSWAEMEKKKDCNLFCLPKLGVCIVRDGDEIVIITEKEKAEVLGK